MPVVRLSIQLFDGRVLDSPENTITEADQVR
jgi:hypothetical protein